RTQFEEVVRVPLIVHGPGLPAGRHVSDPVSLVDVVPTLLSLAGAKAGVARLDGVDLRALLASGGRAPGAAAAERDLFGEADHENAQGDITRMVRSGRYKLHFNRMTRASQLFDLAADRGERTDLAAARPDVARRMLRTLDAFMATAVEGAGKSDLTPEEI